MTKLQTTICTIGLAAAMSASASVTTSFGPLPGATFSGTGIPNNAVEVTTITDGADTITLGLTATPRYQVGELANNGNGTFSVNAGTAWNFDYYASVTGAGNVSDYKFVLGYQLTPGTGLGAFNLSTAYSLQSPAIPIQDSENLGFGFLSAPSSFVTPPVGSYNVNADGDYQFVLDAYCGDTLLGQSVIDVQAVPEPTTIVAGALMLLPFGAGALRVVRNRRAK